MKVDVQRLNKETATEAGETTK